VPEQHHGDAPPLAAGDRPRQFGALPQGHAGAARQGDLLSCTPELAEDSVSRRAVFRQ
jgi:uncharacterized Zn-binding protein involved in type VI secretion